MRLGKIGMAAIVALSVTSAPVLAAANGASALSVARASASLESESELGGGFIIPLLAVVAVGLGIWAAVDDEEPESA